MSDWIDVCDASDLPEGARQIVETDTARILVVNDKGTICAVESMCTHAMFELDDAEIEDGCVVCPLHHAHFCLRTGKVQSPPAYEDLQSYETRIHDGQVQVLTA